MGRAKEKTLSGGGVLGVISEVRFDKSKVKKRNQRTIFRLTERALPVSAAQRDELCRARHNC